MLGKAFVTRLLGAAATVILAFAAGSTVPAAAQDAAVIDWQPGYWTRMNEHGTGNDIATSSTWEGAALDGEEVGLNVWCAKRQNAIGYQITFDESQLRSDLEGYTRITLSVGGQLFELPIEYQWDVWQIPGAPSEKAWTGQVEFLSKLMRARVIELVALSNPAAGETTYFGALMQARGCGSGLERVVALCGKGMKVASAFCDEVFCPGDAPILEHFKRLVDLEPEQTFLQSKEDTKLNAEQAQQLLGDDGVYGFAEGLCFAPNGIALQ